MPQFGTKSLLTVFLLFALWCSTLNGYPAGRDIRASILLVIVAVSLLAVIYFRGRRRAFYLGFLVVMSVETLDGPRRVTPDLGWFPDRFSFLWNFAGYPTEVYSAIQDTAVTATMLGLAMLVGYIGTLIYDQSQSSVPT
jgi:hypothetical protein